MKTFFTTENILFASIFLNAILLVICLLLNNKYKTYKSQASELNSILTENMRVRKLSSYYDDKKSEKNLIKAAKDFLISYFRDGKERTREDFDEDILGGLDTNFAVGQNPHRKPRWNQTPFFEALGELVAEGIVRYKIEENGRYLYWLPTKPDPEKDKKT